MAIEFVWDPKKAVANERKHRVAFQEAVTVFIDPLARIHDDPAHSSHERREIIVGHSLQDRLLVVFFTERGTTVRIVSARQATRHERKDYETRKRS
jgi:uncharacterized DUF497 family protein